MTHINRTHLLDTSALIKLVLNEDGSQKLRTYFNDNLTFYDYQIQTQGLKEIV